MKDKNSEFRLFWRMLRKNKLAMLGLIILTLIVLTAIFANVLAPYDYTAQNLANMKNSLPWSIRSERMSLEETSYPGLFTAPDNHW